MAVSKKRNKDVYVPPRRAGKQKSENPRWLVPVMGSTLIIGVAWIITYYVSGAQLPIGSLGQWNIGAGFLFMVTGFVLATRWR